MNSVSQLSPAAARSLAQRKYRRGTNWSLTLGLKKLDAEVAAILATTSYPLRFRELKQLTKEAKRALTKREAPTYLRGKGLNTWERL